MKKPAFLALMITSLLGSALQAENTSSLTRQAKVERNHIANLVRSGGSVVQSQQGDFTLVSTYENFKVTMPDGVTHGRSIAARVIDPAGNHVAELLVVESANLVAWKVYGEDLSADPIEAAAFELDKVPMGNRFAAGNPIKALTWAHDMLLGIWRGDNSVPIPSVKGDFFRTKDSVGCDGLHWLDNSSLRPCCDDHDMCFATYTCTAASWNPLTASWQCANCNINVAACFVLRYWLRSGIFWEWCWGISCCDSDGWPCVNFECT